MMSHDYRGPNLAAHAGEVVPEPRLHEELLPGVGSSGYAKQQRDVFSAQTPLARLHVEHLRTSSSAAGRAPFAASRRTS